MHGKRVEQDSSNGGPRADLAPHNRDLEEAFLGSILIDPGALSLVRGVVNPDDFSVASYGAAYRAMLDMLTEGLHVDILTLSERLGAMGYGDGVAGGLIKFIANAPTSVHVESYGKIIKDLAMRRRLIDLAGTIAGRAYDEDNDIDAVLNDTLSDVVGVVQHKTGLIENTKEVVRGAIDEVLQRQERPGELWGASTSLPDLDRKLDGFPVGLTVVAGITKHGKTAFALQVAQHHAQQGKHIVMFALEMTAGALVRRLACGRANVDKNKLKRGRLTTDEMKRLNMAFAQIEQENWHFAYKAGITAAEIYSETARLAMQGKCDMVIVDYLQLMSFGTNDRRDLKIGEATRLMHGMGIEFNIPVLCLAQFNRNVHHREDEIPHLSDLKDSGSIEQDAALVIFVHRPEMIYKAQLKDPPTNIENIALLIVAANREGDIFMHKVAWNGPTQQFRELANEQEEARGMR